jgi:hypothetical protein
MDTSPFRVVLSVAKDLLMTEGQTPNRSLTLTLDIESVQPESPLIYLVATNLNATESIQ